MKIKIWKKFHEPSLWIFKTFYLYQCLVILSALKTDNDIEKVEIFKTKFHISTLSKKAQFKYFILILPWPRSPRGLSFRTGRNLRWKLEALSRTKIERRPKRPKAGKRFCSFFCFCFCFSRKSINVSSLDVAIRFVCKLSDSWI